MGLVSSPQYRVSAMTPFDGSSPPVAETSASEPCSTAVGSDQQPRNDGFVTAASPSDQDVHSVPGSLTEDVEGAAEPGSQSPAPLSDEGLAAPPRQRRRAKRRELFCPLHPEQRIFSASPKHHLYLTDVGQLMLRGLSKRRADELLAAYSHVLPLTDEWIECFWCDDCSRTSWWHVKRHDRHVYQLQPVPRELWEQASGVIRVEGNPSVSQFTRRQARATGVQGMRQYRFL
jgi:hypothetical protein